MRRAAASLMLLVAMPWQMPLPPIFKYKPPPPPIRETAETVTAHASHAVKAYQRQTVPLLRVSFRTGHSREKRLVQGPVAVVVPGSASDTRLMASTRLRCHRIGSGPVTYAAKDQIQDVQNVRRGQRLALAPRFVYQTSAPGRYECQLLVGSLRPSPARPDTRPTSNVLIALAGSRLSVSAPLLRSTGQSYAPYEPSSRLDPHESYDAAVLQWTAPPRVTSFRVYSAVKLTSCASRGGSTDPVTDKVLCAGAVWRATATVHAELQVLQLPMPGSRASCPAIRLPFGPKGTVRITPYTHHRMLYMSGTAGVRQRPGCTDRFLVRSVVQFVSGPPVVVHRQGTITTLVPIH